MNNKSPLYNIRMSIKVRGTSISQLEAATRLGVSKRQYQRYEDGEVRVSDKIIRLLELGALQSIPINTKDSKLRTTINEWNNSIL